MFVLYMVFGIFVGIFIAKVTNNFCWSIVDLKPASILDQAHLTIWKIAIWVVIWVALFGAGYCPPD